jgi:transcriptional regulator with XRE-family HTH domain
MVTGSSMMGGRLKEERTRMGLSQEEFAKLGYVGRKAQVSYESGERKPDSEYLQGIAEHGADCQYILTGVRSLNLKDVERAGMEQFMVQFPPIVKLHKEIDTAMLASILSDVLRVCGNHPALQDIPRSTVAEVVVQQYMERKGVVAVEQDASVLAALVKQAG